MFILGHMGIGSRIVSPWAARLPRGWLLVGTQLPDLIDKPLYYAVSLASGGASGADLGLISCSRTFGHTGLFLIALTIASYFRRSVILAALALGSASHLLLDNLSDNWLGTRVGESSAYLALVFPLEGLRFGVAPFKGAIEHLGAMANVFTLTCEVIGAALLAWDEWKIRHRSQIIRAIRGVHRRLRRSSRLPDA